MAEIRVFGVIGAGQMGRGIAQVAAQAGMDVHLLDVDEATAENGVERIAKSLGRLVEKGKIDADERTAVLKRIRPTGDYASFADAQIVVEAATENFEIKQKLFRLADEAMADGAILASNTSSISITKLARVTSRPERVIGMHFMNPVPVMKLVEVIKGLATSEEVTNRTIALAQAMGKTAVPANDRAGFVSNRVLMPMINEAFYAWMEGVAEPADIDEIMKLGMAHPMGPLRLADFIGLDTCVHIMDVLADGLNNDRYRACPLLKQLVTAGRLGDKTGRGVFDYAK